MDAVKQNKFWFGVGGFVLLVLIVGGVFIGALKSEASGFEAQIQSSGDQLKQLNDKADKLPTQEFASATEATYSELEKSRDEIKKYLAGEGSKILSTWFGKLNVRPGGTPTLDQFKPEYLVRTDELKQVLESKKQANGTENIRVGPPKKGKPSFGTSDQEGGFEKINDPTQAMMSQLMKHYWIQKRLVDVLADCGVIALSDVKFRDTPASATATPGMPGGSSTEKAQPPEAGKLPLDMGTIIELDVVIECYYPEVSKVLQKFLTVDKDLPLFTRVKKAEIKKTATPPEKKEVKIPAEEADDPKWSNLQPERIPVKLVLTGEVLDFTPPVNPGK